MSTCTMKVKIILRLVFFWFHSFEEKVPVSPSDENNRFCCKLYNNGLESDKSAKYRNGNNLLAVGTPIQEK